MYARVYDPVEERYYRSVVYACLNTGYYKQYIVLDPIRAAFVLVDYIGKSSNKPLVEIIQDDESGWITRTQVELLKFKRYCTLRLKNPSLSRFRGYPDIADDHAFLAAILEHGSVPLTACSIAQRQLSDRGIWTYIQTQEDAEAFMKLFAGFHDSTLEKLIYEETQRTSRVTATFDNRGWFGVAELCFEGVRSIRIQPPGENLSRELFEGTLFVDDESVFWADSYLKSADTDYDGSHIQALSLKWRKVE